MFIDFKNIFKIIFLYNFYIYLNNLTGHLGSQGGVKVFILPRTPTASRPAGWLAGQPAEGPAFSRPYHHQYHHHSHDCQVTHHQQHKYHKLHPYLQHE